MSLQMVRSGAYSGTAAEVRSQIAKVFTFLQATSPQGVSCTAFSSKSGPDFMTLEMEEAAHIPTGGASQAAQLRELISPAGGGPVPPEPLTLVEAYHS
ncbi:hypothetical protein ABZ371_02695 [Streptomyces sp. NPDC005899]|uniref:hypothetical protein n=1 Tax=Streptomyces sp. NPDC005899 TaxID=3155716 RepID=UPI0033CEB9B0